MIRNCPICSSNRNEKIFRQSFCEILGLPNKIYDQTIAICKDCGAIYTSVFVEEKALKHYYASMSTYEYSESGGVIGEPHKKRGCQQYDYIKKFIKPESVLDIGCSTGYTLNLFKQDGMDVIGIDPSEKCSEIASEIYDVEVKVGFYEKSMFPEKQFDLVILSHVMEHILEPKKFLKSVRSILSDKGALYIEVPDTDSFGREDLFQFNFEHVNYFNKKSLSNIMGICGYCALDIRNFMNSKDIAPFYPVLASLWQKSRKRDRIENYYNENLIKINHYVKLVSEFKAKLDITLEETLKGSKKIALWSAGTLTANILANTDLLDYPIIAIFDNDPKKDEKVMAGIRVLKPLMESSYFKGLGIDTILITSWSSADDIYRQIRSLEDAGIKIVKLF